MPFQLRFILFVNQFLHMYQKNCHNIFILLTLDQSLKNVITLGIPSQKKSTIQKVDMCPASYSCSQGGGREIHFNAGDLLFNFAQHESILQCNQNFFLFLYGRDIFCVEFITKISIDLKTVQKTSENFESFFCHAFLSVQKEIGSSYFIAKISNEKNISTVINF